MSRKVPVLVLTLLAAAFLAVMPAVSPVSPARADEDSVAALAELSAHIDSAIQLTNAGDIEGAKAEFDAFHEGWEGIEDGVREVSPDIYVEIEEAMGDVRLELGEAAPDAGRIAQALTHLDNEIDELVETAASAGSSEGTAALKEHVESAIELASAGDLEGARAEFDAFHEVWEEVEDGIREASPDLYVEIEEAMGDVRLELDSTAPDAGRVSQALAQLETEVDELGEAPAGTGSVEGIDELEGHVESAIQLMNAGDIEGASAEFEAFHEVWEEVEDGVRDVSRDVYLEIEEAMGDVSIEFSSATPDATRITQALTHLETEVEEVEQIAAGGGSQAEDDGDDVEISTLVHYLDSALAGIESGDTAKALEEVDEFRHDWVVVEGLIKGKSSGDYESIENGMALAKSQLSKDPPDVEGAQGTLTEMRETLEPYAEGDITYGVFDSAVILLREGLEALLIVGALLTFLKKIGQEDKSKWVWAGSGAGVAASVVVAVIITSIFAGAAAAGANREIMEGATGLFAAAMLIYMSYWLHTNASLGNWRRYIQQKMQAALATNRLLSLSLIAFLAVFREGAETVLFYIGIAPATSTGDLLLGILIGLAALAVFGVVFIVFGKRFPLRPFFTVASVLVLYLAFKFVGNGIHALQVADVVPATASDSLPTSSFFGIYPTWETFGAQLALAGVVVAVLVWRRIRATLMRNSRQSEAVTTS